MNKPKYPKGAIKSLKKIDALLKQAKRAPVSVYCVWKDANGLQLDRTTFDKKTTRRYHTLDDIKDKKYKSLDLDGFNILEPCKWGQHAYLFTNFWFAYAHHLRVKQTGDA